MESDGSLSLSALVGVQPVGGKGLCNSYGGQKARQTQALDDALSTYYLHKTEEGSQTAVFFNYSEIMKI